MVGGGYHIECPWTQTKKKNEGFKHPKYMGVITPKNEGLGAHGRIIMIMSTIVAIALWPFVIIISVASWIRRKTDRHVQLPMVKLPTADN